jgi:hypothetical protein
MTALVMHCDIRPYEKSVHLFVVSHVKEIFFAEFRQTSPPSLFSQCAMTGCIHPNCICLNQQKKHQGRRFGINPVTWNHLGTSRGRNAV